MSELIRKKAFAFVMRTARKEMENQSGLGRDRHLTGEDSELD